jgi:hypothetical protein
MNERHSLHGIRALAPCALFAMATVLLPVGASAADDVRRDAVPMLNLTVGQAGILDSDDPPLRYGIEYRARSFSRWKLIPAIGAAFADDGASFIYTDLRHDFWLDDRWVLIPSFGVGVFDDGDELDLGHTIEFRSGLEVAYRFRAEYRIGVALFHLSNGGISDQNPGTEVLVLSLCIPLHHRDRRR